MVAEYLDYSLVFFRTARQEYGDLFSSCAASGRKHIVLYGAGELAEIASLAAYAADVEVKCVLDYESNQARVAGLPVVRDLADIPSGAVLVITDGRKPQESYDKLSEALGRDRVFAPPFLRISLRQHFVE